MLKKAGKALFIFFLLLSLVIISVIAPIDDTPLNEIEIIQETLSHVKQATLETTPGDSVLIIGWASTNITPEMPINMAGYGPRGPYDSVLDSLFSRCIVIDNGSNEMVIISLDLIMFPRHIKSKVQEKLKEHGFSENEIYLSATHTHSGFGNWERSVAGELMFGSFHEENADFLLQQIVKGVLKAKADKSPAKIGFTKIDANELVMNRLAENGTKDPFLRVVHFKKEDGRKGLIVSYAGHAVNMDSDVWELSRDYPGILVDELEHHPTLDFAMFCAGMVGSHNIKIDIKKGHERIIKTGRLLSDKILSNPDSIIYNSNTSLGGIDIDIHLPPSQLRITKSIRLRDWVFSSLFGPLNANIKALSIGDILLIGMPCDYSGELSINNQLDEFAEKHGKQLFITSFNGNYIGYITEDDHYYTCDHDEVKSLNWVGPYKGAFFTELIKEVIEHTDN